MVSIGRVWDRTTEVLQGRGTALAEIAALTVFLPAVVLAAYDAYVPNSVGSPHFRVAITLFASLTTVWGQLAMVAFASDPAHTRALATALATRRLPLMVGLVAALGVAFFLFLVPGFMIMGPTLSPASLALMQAGVMPALGPRLALFASLYLLVFAVLFLVIGARLFLLNAVVVNERLGFASILRSFRLTDGLTWKLLGLLLLYATLVFVAVGAARLGVGVVARLILGADGVTTATFLSAVAAAAVSALFSVIATVFAGQLYVAARDRAKPV